MTTFQNAFIESGIPMGIKLRKYYYPRKIWILSYSLSCFIAYLFFFDTSEVKVLCLLISFSILFSIVAFEFGKWFRIEFKKEKQRNKLILQESQRRKNDLLKNHTGEDIDRETDPETLIQEKKNFLSFILFLASISITFCLYCLEQTGLRDVVQPISFLKFFITVFCLIVLFLLAAIKIKIKMPAFYLDTKEKEPQPQGETDQLLQNQKELESSDILPEALIEKVHNDLPPVVPVKIVRNDNSGLHHLEDFSSYKFVGVKLFFSSFVNTVKVPCLFIVFLVKCLFRSLVSFGKELKKLVLHYVTYLLDLVLTLLRNFLIFLFWNFLFSILLVSISQTIERYFFESTFVLLITIAAQCCALIFIVIPLIFAAKIDFEKKDVTKASDEKKSFRELIVFEISRILRNYFRIFQSNLFDFGRICGIFPFLFMISSFVLFGLTVVYDRIPFKINNGFFTVFQYPITSLLFSCVVVVIISISIPRKAPNA